MTDEQIKYMAERFLSWRLPEQFHPDNGIKFVPVDPWHTTHPNKVAHWPVGTNLFDYEQALTMVRHMVEGLPAQAGEAGTATTPESGVVHEHAVSEADAPIPSSDPRLSRMREALEAICEHGVLRDSKWAGMTARDIAIWALREELKEG